MALSHCWGFGLEVIFYSHFVFFIAKGANFVQLGVLGFDASNLD